MQASVKLPIGSNHIETTAHAVETGTLEQITQ